MLDQTQYDPMYWEPIISDKWKAADVGSPEAQMKYQNGGTTPEDIERYSIIMPPPNLTAKLHAGHAFQHYLMDVVSRTQRLKGSKTLWYPGVDHAGLQMEGVIKKIFEKEGRARREVTNEEFLAMCWEKASEWRGQQKAQSIILGDTPDYERELFTLDPRATKMVNHAFLSYYNDGLISKSHYLVNWSVGLQTALSDVSGEIEYIDQIDPLITFVYGDQTARMANGTEDSLVLRLNDALRRSPFYNTTVRPETIFGDVAIVVHPDTFVGNLTQSFTHEETQAIIDAVRMGQIIIECSLPEFDVIARLLISDKVDPSFGSGTLKVTPGSDVFDYELYTKDLAHYNLPKFKQVINRDGLMADNIVAKYIGLTREKARTESIHELLKNNRIGKGPIVNDIKYIPEEFHNYDDISLLNIDWRYEHSVMICERTKTIVEPLVSEEFFVKFDTPTSNNGKTLVELGLEGVAETKFYPAEYANRANDFLNNIQDWCISRDLVWGHRIPVWYNLDNNPNMILYPPTVLSVDVMIGDRLEPLPRSECMRVQATRPLDAGNWVQESKILDTWFSSSLWPLTTLNYYTARDKVNSIAFDLVGVLFDEYGEPRDDGVHFLEQVYNAGINCYYLTNAANDLLEKVQEDEHVFSMLKGGISTSEVGFSQIHPEFYQLFIQKYAIDPSKMIFLDRSIDRVTVAEAQGIIPLHVREGMDYSYELNGILDSRVTDFEEYYPTGMMTTAKEIFYLWIVRMIVLGKYFTGVIPFENLVITPTITDAQGRKMSKSLGNGLDPEITIKEYSSDALRMAMMSGMIPDRNMRFSDGIATTLLEKYRNFGNKIWNIARFFEYQVSLGGDINNIETDLSSAAEWITNRYLDATRSAEISAKEFDFANCVDEYVKFIWDDYAGRYVEYLKTNPRELGYAHKIFKSFCMQISPLYPFLMEVLWSQHFGETTLLAHAKMQKFAFESVDISRRSDFDHLITFVDALRSFRGLFRIDPVNNIQVYTTDSVLLEYSDYLRLVSRIDFIDTLSPTSRPLVNGSDAAVDIINYVQDVELEVSRARSEIQAIEAQLERLNNELTNQMFLERAKEDVINEKKKNKEERLEELERLFTKIKILTENR
jgi:valyl-tRNA synthetase